MIDQQTYYKYWGKAGRKEGEQHLHHLLVYHSLDVAAVGWVILKSNHRLRKTLASLVGIDDEEAFVRWMVFFLALHDIGKFIDGFQNLRPDILKILQQRASKATYGRRHDVLGYYLWWETLRPHFYSLGIVDKPKGRGQSAATQVVDVWMKAATGHHGLPPKREDNLIISRFMNEAQDGQAAKAFATDLRLLLLGDSHQFPQLDLSQVKFASWWLAGFTVLCDWLGSGREAQEFCSEVKPLPNYWDEAIEWADGAVKRSGLLPSPVSQSFSLADFFLPGTNPTPTPLQDEAINRELDEGPQLFILEDVTGAGKTEAAILLLHRLMKQGSAEGVYFGLPTMATSNGMYRRMGQVYRKLYSSHSHPSCVLAHSAREMSGMFRNSIATVAEVEQKNHGDGTLSASAHCNAWLADNRKKALLAEMGVGTIDQALLAVLPSKHQSLRMLGMLGKVLLCDEIHSADAYMTTLLCELLRAHAAAGGSAILLSATLSLRQRRQLVSAFAKGLNQAAPELTKTAESDYPLITHCGRSVFDEKVLSTRDSVKRSVTIKFVHDEQSVQKVIQQASKKGRCVCWIRNTVKDARKAYSALADVIPERKLDLFHARYALHDRLKIEGCVTSRFGSDRGADERKGQVLISSSVIEQSLDVCFDLMITDIAPIDLVIQRAGRLQRHIRDSEGNRIEGVDGRGGAVLYVLAPEWSETPKADWLKSPMAGTNAIYESSQIWLTQKRLRQDLIFRMPEDARSLIESVYSDEAAESVPEGLLASANEEEGNRYSEVSLAKSNVLKLDAGYEYGEANIWWEEASTPTRLGEESISVYLARWYGGKLTPWVDEGDYRWAQSAVSMLKKKIAFEAENAYISEELVANIKEALPSKGAWGVLMPLELIEGGVWRGYAEDHENQLVTFYYDERRGLMEAEEIEGAGI